MQSETLNFKYRILKIFGNKCKKLTNFGQPQYFYKMSEVTEQKEILSYNEIKTTDIEFKLDTYFGTF